jgi:geranylgeranyl transferase type-2 subunit beta
MSDQPYLLRLTATLGESARHLPADFCRRQAEYFRRCQNEDGGFAGRDGLSDLYYTAFALRGLAILGELDRETALRATAYLGIRRTGTAQVVDFFSFLYAAVLVQSACSVDLLADAPTDWPRRVADVLESFRAPDGGYAKTPGGALGSTYQTFLVALCYEMLGQELPRAEEVVRFVRSRMRSDGGFVDIAPMSRSGTNPTAAGIALLQMMDALDGATKEAAAKMLLARQANEGGLTANGRIPMADLLSTFTGAWTLYTCGALRRLDVPAARRYVESLSDAKGGFRGGHWDLGVDVEYTFYGIGALALFSWAES